MGTYPLSTPPFDIIQKPESAGQKYKDIKTHASDPDETYTTEFWSGSSDL